ncbi:MAG: chemotaxis protein CheW [Calditrichaeota bacterium]|nr:chemotaxis protein CheW [Calditrichota bacterium]
MPIIEDDEIIRVFIEESHEHMNGIEADLLDIEKDGENINTDLVNKVFRAIHSVKGGAGFLGLENIKELAHEMENLLNLIRNKELIVNSDIINALLISTDKLNELITNYQNSNSIDISEELVTLKGATSASLPEEIQETINTSENICLPNGNVIFEVNTFDLDQAQKGGRILYLTEFDLIRDVQRKDKTPLDIIKEIQQAGILVESKIDIDAVGTLYEEPSSIIIPFFVLFSTVLEQDIISKFVNVDESKIFYFNKERKIFALQETHQEAENFVDQLIHNENNYTVEESLAVEKEESIEQKTTEPKSAKNGHKEPKKAVKHEAKPKEALPEGKKPSVQNSKNEPLAKESSVSFTSETLRVNVKDLDTLMTLAGELVLTRNQLLQTHNTEDKKGIENAIQRVNLITSELQEAIMATRMQPIGIVFNKFQRIVRDLSKKLNKVTDLIIEGEGVEMDKTIIEAIGDPLTHLVRNAIDHGIEEPSVRLSHGKSETAVLRLSASHEAGQVIIKIEDDGAGIDPEKVKAKALENELVSKSELDLMSHDEIIKLIFKPGFSLAKEVTDISGRGVGMDVVFSNLSKLGGSIDIKSKVNSGTSIRIKLPLTLAIIPCLIIKSAENRFAIPQINLVELVRIPFTQVKNRLERIDNALILRLRGSLLPIINLNESISKDTQTKDHDNKTWHILDQIKKSGKFNNKGAFNIVVVNAGSFNYGIIVDELLDSEEIVVKPLGLHLRHLHTYAGATILGDGRAALILDINGISKEMKLKEVKRDAKEEAAIDLLSRKDSQSMVIVNNGNSEQFAIPLGLISRIEKIHKSDPVMTSGRLALKYRGSNLIVLSVEDVANVKPRVESENPYVIIFEFGGKEVGVIVSHIIDVVETSAEIDEDTFRQPGIVGSAVILDKITLMLDLYGLAAAAMPERMIERENERLQKSTKKQNTILIVEDSKFFLKQISGFTEDAGYKVVTALNGEEALERLHQEKEIDLILTDIEMPAMDGIELTRRVRSEERYRNMPILALTSVAGDEAERVAMDAGIDEYLIKLDREKVLSNIASYLENGRMN